VHRVLPIAALLLVLADGSGCATFPTARRGASVASDGAALLGGDVVLGIESLDARRADSRIVRYRRSLSDGEVRVEARTLLTADGVPRAVQATADGRWLAATLEHDGALATTLWRLRDGRPDPVWESPEGCAQPTFDPAGGFLVLACPPIDRQPAWLLRLSLPDLAQLALVGERPRGAPAVGVEGDLYWVERRGPRSVVLRRSAETTPFVTHELFDVVEALHPREDGVLVATVRNALGGLELLDLHPSGAVRPRSLPAGLGVGSPARLLSTAEGDLIAIRCLRGDCAVVEAPVEGTALPALTVSGRPVSLAAVPLVGGARRRPEDLATAPSTVLATHLSSDVAVLGVGLGMKLDAAWAVLEDAELQPWWETGQGSRGRPRSIGLGRAGGSWCVEFQADDRGTVVSVDLRDCAAPYLSPALRPLLDRRHLIDGAYGIVQRFLGPGVSMEVGDRVGGPGEARSHPVRRTTLQYDAPERGYQYRSETEVLDSRSSRLWDGRVWLRLQEPGKRQAVRP
jgi:hypothetical protein